jgi:hypothetical protein
MLATQTKNAAAISTTLPATSLRRIDVFGVVRITRSLPPVA